MATRVSTQRVTANRSRGRKLLIYAEPGWGKTPLLGGFPKPLIIRAPQENTDSIKSGVADEAIIHDWDEMWDIFEQLRHGLSDQYDWVGLDSISIWQDVGLDDLWESLIIEKPHRAKYGLDKGEYKINMDRIGRWVRHMVGMADAGLFNFCITAHPRDMKQAEFDDAPIKIMPHVQGVNMSPKICGYMHAVGYGHYTKKGTKVLSFHEHQDYYAKDTLQAFGEKGAMFNPTSAAIVTALEASRPKPKAKPKTAARKTTARRTVTTRRK